MNTMRKGPMDRINYGKLVDEAMHLIVYKVLKIIEQEGLPRNHHFFISFLTQHPQARISQTLKNKYPREMTIVLQYQFHNLKVEETGFTVTLSFSGAEETIFVPFVAVTTFADPSVQFGLQFRETAFDEEHKQELDKIDEEIRRQITAEIERDMKKQGKSSAPAATDAGKTAVKAKKDDSSNIVSLEKFRNKKDNQR